MLFGETPMRASPADCKSALRLGGAPARAEGKLVGLAVVGVVGGEGVGAVELLYEYELGEAVREGEAG